MGMEDMVLVASPEVLERFLAIRPEDDTAYVMRYSPSTVLVRTKYPSAVMRRKWNQVRNGVKGSRWVPAGSYWELDTARTMKEFAELMKYQGGYWHVEFIDSGVAWPEK